MEQDRVSTAVSQGIRAAAHALKKPVSIMRSPKSLRVNGTVTVSQPNSAAVDSPYTVGEHECLIITTLNAGILTRHQTTCLFEVWVDGGVAERVVSTNGAGVSLNLDPPIVAPPGSTVSIIAKPDTAGCTAVAGYSAYVAQVG